MEMRDEGQQRKDRSYSSSSSPTESSMFARVPSEILIEIFSCLPFATRSAVLGKRCLPESLYDSKLLVQVHSCVLQLRRKKVRSRCVSPCCRREIIPRVCKAWAQLARSASNIWWSCEIIEAYPIDYCKVTVNICWSGATTSQVRARKPLMSRIMNHTLL